MLLSFRTVTGRLCSAEASEFSSLDALLDFIAEHLSLRRPTLRLFRGAHRLLSLADVVNAASSHACNSLRPALGRAVARSATIESILVVGTKKDVGATGKHSSEASGAGSPTLSTPPSEEGDGPLHFPHVPGGLVEMGRIIAAHEESQGRESDLYDQLRAHPTVQAMSAVLRHAAHPEAMARSLLLQVQRSCPGIVDWIRRSGQMFVMLMNGSENTYAASDLMQLVLRSVGGFMFGNGDATEGTLLMDGFDDTTLQIAGEDGAVIVVQTTGQLPAGGEMTADVTIHQLPDSESNGEPQHALGVADHDIGIEQLEAAMAQLDNDLFTEASLARDLAAAYELRVRSLESTAPLSGEANATLRQATDKAGFYYRKAVSLIIRAVKACEPEHVAILHGLCQIAPLCCVGAQLWFRSRDSMSCLAAHLAHLNFWDLVDRKMPTTPDAAPTGHHVRTNTDSLFDGPSSALLAFSAATSADDNSSVIFSHPGTARASATDDHVSSSAATSVETLLGDPFEESMRLMRYTVRHQSTLVLYSLLGTDSMLVYVLRGGNEIHITEAPVVYDGFKGSITFVEEALRARRFGVNLNLLWYEHLREMYRALVLPVEQWLPCRPAEVDDPNAGHVCFVVSFSPVPLPFAAMVDGNGIPCMAKWAVFQAHNPSDLFAAETNEFIPHARTTILSEFTPAWLSRHLGRCLNATSSRPAPSRGGAPPTSMILHVDNIESYTVANLPSCDLFVCERFTATLRFAIRRAALVRGLMTHEDDDAVLPYEFCRTLYMALCDGNSIARSARLAMLSTARAYPLEPWKWASMMLFNFGGPLRYLERHVESVTLAQQRREQQVQRTLRAAATTPESRYSEYLGINTLYDAMLQGLLREKPDTIDSIEDCLIATLESFPQDFRSTRPSSTTTSIGRGSGAHPPATPRIAPTPPDRPQGKVRPGPTLLTTIMEPQPPPSQSGTPHPSPRGHSAHESRDGL